MCYGALGRRESLSFARATTEGCPGRRESLSLSLSLSAICCSRPATQVFKHPYRTMQTSGGWPRNQTSRPRIKAHESPLRPYDPADHASWSDNAATYAADTRT